MDYHLQQIIFKYFKKNINIDDAKKILKNYDINIYNYNNQSLLLYYLLNNMLFFDIKIIEYILEQGFLINSKRGILQNSLIHNYIKHKAINIPVIKLFIQYGMDINIQNANGESILHTYFETKNIQIKIVQFFIQNKFDVNIVDNNNNTIIHYLINNNNISHEKKIFIMKLIFDQDFNINLRNKSDQTILDYYIENITYDSTSQQTYQEIFDLCLKYGFDIYTLQDIPKKINIKRIINLYE